MVSILVAEFVSVQDEQIAPTLIHTVSKLQKVKGLQHFLNLKTIQKTKELFYHYAEKDQVGVVDSLIIIFIGISSSENSLYTDMLLENDVLNMIQLVFQKQFQQCYFHCFFLLFNISIGSEQQKKRILAHPNLFKQIMEFSHYPEKKVSQEAIWCLSGFTNSKDMEVVNFILQNDILRKYKELLFEQEDNMQILKIILEGMTNMMVLFVESKNDFQYKQKLIAEGIVDLVEKLQYSIDDFVYYKSLKLLCYFQTKREFQE